MVDEPPPPSSRTSALGDETKLLREEVDHQRHDAEAREAREKAAEELKNRVSVAAIILTTALSFIGNVRSNRADVLGEAKAEAETARRDGAELWAYYQTKLAERTTLDLGHSALALDLRRRGIARDDPSAKLEALRLADYEERIRDFDVEARRVLFRVQDLEEIADRATRRKRDPDKAIFRYDLGSKLITLALILLSVTILSNRRWLFWGGVLLGAIGVVVAFDGYLILV